MRKLALVVLFAAAALPAAAQWRLGAPMEVHVAAGGSVEIDVLVTNQGMTPATGAFLLRGFLPVPGGATFGQVVSSDPSVGCTAQGVIAGNHVMTCFCDPITVESQAGVTTKFTIGVPLSALPGSRIDFGITYQFGGGSTSGRSVAIRVTDSGAPQLRVRLRQVHLEQTDEDEAEAEYYVIVANIGNAETSGPVDLEVSLSLPYGVSAKLLPMGDTVGFLPDGSKVTHRVSQTLPPPDENGHVFEYYSPLLPFAVRPLPRGQYEIIALASGGGSPPAEARDHFTLEQLEMRQLAEIILHEALLIFTGRIRQE